MTRTLSVRSTSSNGPENLASRSRRRNRTPESWPSIASGDEGEWELHYAMDLGELAKKFATASSDSMMSFGVVASSEASTDFGFVGVRVGEIATWHIDGMFDPSVAAALAAELQALEGEDGP
jgi:hypothetical protein